MTEDIQLWTDYMSADPLYQELLELKRNVREKSLIPKPAAKYGKGLVKPNRRCVF